MSPNLLYKHVFSGSLIRQAPAACAAARAPPQLAIENPDYLKGNTLQALDSLISTGERLSGVFSLIATDRDKQRTLLVSLVKDYLDAGKAVEAANLAVQARVLQQENVPKAWLSLGGFTGSGDCGISFNHGPAIGRRAGPGKRRQLKKFYLTRLLRLVYISMAPTKRFLNSDYH